MVSPFGCPLPKQSEGGCPDLVRIQPKTIRKHYGRGKSEYRYKQHLLPFPIGQNEALKPFLEKELHFKMNAKDDTLNVTLKRQKEKMEASVKTPEAFDRFERDVDLTMALKEQI
jgi:hypothetical protein